MRSIVLRAVVAAVAALAVSGAVAGAAMAWRAPRTSYVVGDPGVIFSQGRWNLLATGGWSGGGEISTAPVAKGPWNLTGGHLLTRRPKWASARNHSVWAPSEARIGTHYVVFYAAVIAGGAPKRCIGTGVSASATGPFVPRAHPISCVAGHGAPDPEPGVAAINSTIDPTPAWARIAGRRRLFLTYKTQHRKADRHYFSTIRMVRLNPGTLARTVVGKSHTLTVQPNNIEENPVIVQRGKVFTLFTSLGGFTLCSYHTEWRQSTRIWHWPAASHRLSFPGNTNTCGTGDAQVTRGLPKNSWRIFWSGHYPAGQPFRLYVGRVAWPGGRPVVSAVL
jgi:hypothetical protein